MKLRISLTLCLKYQQHHKAKLTDTNYEFSVDAKKPSAAAETSDGTEQVSALPSETSEGGNSSEEEEGAGNTMTEEVQCGYTCHRGALTLKHGPAL